MTKHIVTAIIILTCNTTFSQTSNDSAKAMAVLSNMQHAIQQIKTLHYSSAYNQVNAEMDDSLFGVSGNVWFVAQPNDSIFKCRLHIAGSREGKAFDYYYDGDKTYELQHADKQTTIIYPHNFRNDIHNPAKSRIAFLPFIELLTDTIVTQHLLAEKPTLQLSETPATWQVTLQYPKNSYGALITKKLIINKATNLPVEINSAGEFNGTHFRSIYAISNISLNEAAINDSVTLQQPHEDYTMEEVKAPNKNYVDTTAKYFNGRPAWQFNYASTTGQKIKLGNYKGKYVLLDFWESWCGYCILAIPKIDSLYNTYKSKGLQVLGVTTENITQIKKIIERNALSYPTLVGDTSILTQYKIEGRPTYVLIGPDGKIVNYATGDLEAIEKDLQRLLAAR